MLITDSFVQLPPNGALSLSLGSWSSVKKSAVVAVAPTLLAWPGPPSMSPAPAPDSSCVSCTATALLLGCCCGCSSLPPKLPKSRADVEGDAAGLALPPGLWLLSALLPGPPVALPPSSSTSLYKKNWARMTTSRTAPKAASVKKGRHGSRSAKLRTLQPQQQQEQQQQQQQPKQHVRLNGSNWASMCSS